MAANKFRTAKQEKPVTVNGYEVLNPMPVINYLDMMGVSVEGNYSVSFDNEKITIFLPPKQ